MKFKLVVLLLGIVLAVPATATANKSIHSPTAQIAKKKCKKKHGKRCKKRKAPVYVPPPPAPLALTDSEVRGAVNQAAFNYCLPDVFCYNYGIYVDYSGGPISCSSKQTYEWSCYGWNDEFDGLFFYTCDFREIVDRTGYNGVTSHQDLTFGSNGWNCFLLFGKQPGSKNKSLVSSQEGRLKQ